MAHKLVCSSSDVFPFQTHKLNKSFASNANLPVSPSPKPCAPGFRLVNVAFTPCETTRQNGPRPQPFSLRKCVVECGKQTSATPQPGQVRTPQSSECVVNVARGVRAVPCGQRMLCPKKKSNRDSSQNMNNG